MTEERKELKKVQPLTIPKLGSELNSLKVLLNEAPGTSAIPSPNRAVIGDDYYIREESGETAVINC